MTNLVATRSESDAEIRRNCQARVTENDRRPATGMRRLMLLIAAALAPFCVRAA
jgi:hypothetical protein